MRRCPGIHLTDYNSILVAYAEINLGYQPIERDCDNLLNNNERCETCRKIMKDTITEITESLLSDNDDKYLNNYSS